MKDLRYLKIGDELTCGNLKGIIYERGTNHGLGYVKAKTSDGKILYSEFGGIEIKAKKP